MVRSWSLLRLMPGLVVTILITAAGEVLPAAAQRGELIERTLAIVGGQVITLTDVQTAMALALIEPEHTTSLNAATLRLVDRLLVLREVQRYLPLEPGEAGIESRLDAVRQRLGGAGPLAAALTRGGFTETRLRAWLRDDVRIETYLAQRFAAVGVPSDEDVSAYYTAHREEFERTQQSLEAASTVIRERLSAERRDQLIADWVLDLRRRTPVVELWKNSGAS